VYNFDLYFGTSKVFTIGGAVDDIDGDTSIMLTFTRLDHGTGNEYSSHSVLIKAVEEKDPSIPDGPRDSKDADPIDDGSSDPPAPDEPDSGSEDDIEPVVQGSSSFSGTWMIIPVAVLLMLIGIGSYVWIAKRKRGVKG